MKATDHTDLDALASCGDAELEALARRLLADLARGKITLAFADRLVLNRILGTIGA